MITCPEKAVFSYNGLRLLPKTSFKLKRAAALVTLSRLPMPFMTKQKDYCCYDIRPLLLAWVSAVSGNLLIAPAISAEMLYHFDIPAQSLNDALLMYANQAHIQLLFSADMVRGFSSKTMQGDLEPKQALELLLKNSGLGYRFIDPATATLLEQQSQINTPSSATEVTLMDSLTVTAKRPSKAFTNLASPVDAIGPEAGYRVTNIASATRTDTPIKEIPQSIQTINRQLIDDQQTLFLSDALNNVSGVVTRNLLFSPVIEGTLVRGFRAEQLIDGFTQYYNTGDRESTVNVERVEVLKGANAIFLQRRFRLAGGWRNQRGLKTTPTRSLPRNRFYRR